MKQRISNNIYNFLLSTIEATNVSPVTFTTVLSISNGRSIPIIINDKIELIEFADGLHLGQEDLDKIHKDKKLAVKLVRLKIKDKLLGLSTHNEIEILEANELPLDMIGLGAYKNSSTKIS